MRFTLFCLLATLISLHGKDEGVENTLRRYKSTYLEKRFLEKIDREEVDVIFELGAHEGYDAIKLHKWYQRPVYAFECHPDSIKNIKTNCKYYPQVRLVEKAVADITGEIPFFCSYWTADSSIYRFQLSTLKRNNRSNWPKVKHMYESQHEITVQATRLDEWCAENGINHIDLLCIDIQGATLPALKGLGAMLDRVKYIITEVEYRQVYQGEPVFPDIHKFMTNRGFRCYFQKNSRSAVSSDVLFVRQDL